MNAYKAQIAALLAQTDKSPLDTAIFLTRWSNEHRRDVWRVSRDDVEAVEEWIEKDRALFELQLDALYRAKAAERSDNDLVRLIGGTIAAKITKQTGHRDNWDVVDRDEDGQVTWVHPMSGVEPQIVARAVLAKLRADGVIR